MAVGKREQSPLVERNIFRSDFDETAGFYLLDSNPRWKPEHFLLYAVLADAISCFQKYYGRRGGPGLTLYRESRDWFFSDDVGWPFSFLNTCEFLNLDPSVIKKMLKEWQEEKRRVPIFYFPN